MKGLPRISPSCTWKQRLGVLRLVDGMTRARVRVLGFYERRPNVPIVNPAITDPNQHLNANSYQKGGWVLHMLRHKVGDDAFWTGIRSYYANYRDANATSEDFQKEMEEASGQNLTSFFRQWLYQAGQPMLSGTWSYAGGKVKLVLEQTQTTGLFNFPLDVAIQNEDGEVSIETVQFDGAKAAFSFNASQKPAQVVLDPDVWLLAGFDLKEGS